MKIAIIALVKLEKDKLLHYNPQSLGLAKGLASLGCNVDVYSFEKLDGESKRVSSIAPGVRLIQQDALGFGGNTIRATKHLETDYECVLCFSDIQISYSGLDRWCSKNKISLFPYVGVIKSSKQNKLIRGIMGIVAKRNIKKYRRRLVFAKTVPLQQELEKHSISTVLAPVGLDLSYLKGDFSDFSLETSKSQAGFRSEDRIILFVGRLVEEKRPLELIDLFRKIHEHDNRFKLCIIGEGHLRPAMQRRIAEFNLTDQVRHYPVVKNASMWTFYKMADFSINLNKEEIFGMSILEAMYYKTMIVARRAPGPEMIIDHMKDGYLCDSDEEILKYITATNHSVSVDHAHKKIIEHFNWDRTSRIMLNAIKSKVPQTELL